MVLLAAPIDVPLLSSLVTARVCPIDPKPRVLKTLSVSDSKC